MYISVHRRALMDFQQAILLCSESKKALEKEPNIDGMKLKSKQLQYDTELAKYFMYAAMCWHQIGSLQETELNFNQARSFIKSEKASQNFRSQIDAGCWEVFMQRGVYLMSVHQYAEAIKELELTKKYV